MGNKNKHSLTNTFVETERWCVYAEDLQSVMMLTGDCKIMLIWMYSVIYGVILHQ